MLAKLRALFNPPAESAIARARQAHLRLGRRGEVLAAQLLNCLGVDVLAHNYRSRRGEIDLVGRDGITLCFVEVKTRRRLGLFRPAAAVGRAKRHRIRACARDYLHELQQPPLNCRFDVIELIIPGQQVTHAYYWPNAFRATEPRSGSDLWPS